MVHEDDLVAPTIGTDRTTGLRMDVPLNNNVRQIRIHEPETFSSPPPLTNSSGTPTFGIAPLMLHTITAHSWRTSLSDLICLTVAGPEERMDPMYMSYSQANGVPQESKLATYMNRQNPVTSPSGHTQSLTKSLAGLCLDQGVKKVTPQAPEFVPGANGSPSFLAQYGGPTGSPGFVRRGSEESPLAVSPRLTPQPSPPLSNSSPTLDKTPITPVSTYQVT
ncbi:unnamed protein product, partial [Timema podura]|nr:unnamed protein product [Timema podura]